MRIQSHIKILKSLLVILFFIKSWNLFAQKEAINIGKKTFQTRCGSCHSIHYEFIGPALASITKKRSTAWLISFIKNSQHVIASEDEYANFLIEQYDHRVMPSFALSDDEIKNVLNYIERESINPSSEINKIEPSNVIDYVNPDILRGRDLFRNQCASCHSITKENYGPALGSIAKRRPQSWLIKFIKNSQEVIKTGDPYSNFLFNKFEKKIMVPMEFLSVDEIQDILKYIEFTANHQLAGNKSTKENSILPSAEGDYTESKRGNTFFKVFVLVITTIGLGLNIFLVITFYKFLKE